MTILLWKTKNRPAVVDDDHNYEFLFQNKKRIKKKYKEKGYCIRHITKSLDNVANASLTSEM